MNRKGGIEFMDHNERKLSDYIDSLNAEKTPNEHKYPTNSSDLEQLFKTVRQVRSLKEPTLPGPDFQQRLVQSDEPKLSMEKRITNKKRRWFPAVASIAAILVITVFMNFIFSFDRTNIVSAMAEAFQEIEAYHGILEIVETNANGESTSQAKLKVWADKEGHYYMQGLAGSHADLITVNNGQQKWQVRPDLNEVHIFPAFPDAYRFTFELGKEIENVRNALSYEVTGEDMVAGRLASIVEVSPQGGVPYRIWIDKETKLPLQKEYGMQNAVQYRITYTEIEFHDAIPEELIAFQLPKGFKEINTNPEQLITDMNQVQELLGFTPTGYESIPSGYSQDSIAIVPNEQLMKLYYTTPDKDTTIIVIQGQAVNEFKPVTSAILAKINNRNAEIQSPVFESLGVLGGGGTYAGATNISSIRWQQDEFEYAIIGNAPLEELISFTKSLTNSTFEMPEKISANPQVEVPFDLTVEENDQKSVDAGSSPWKLDPVFVTQVFVSLKITPEGITGEYPIKSEDLKVIQNTGNYAIVEVIGDDTPIRRIYLKRLIRQDSTGIWTVIGYDPVE